MFCSCALHVAPRRGREKKTVCSKLLRMVAFVAFCKSPRGSWQRTLLLPNPIIAAYRYIDIHSSTRLPDHLLDEDISTVMVI